MDKRAFFKISYGMYVVASFDGEKMNGQIANTVFQVTSEPAQFVVCLNKKNLTHSFIEKNGVFSVSVLEKDTPMKFIGRFGFKSGQEFDKFEGVDYRKGKTGAPIVLENCLACLECEVREKTDLGTHTAFVGEVVGAEVLKEGSPMTYAFYHEMKNGKSPARAPTYVPENKDKGKEEKEEAMKKYKCLVCGYVYDPEKGDPDSGISAGTSFEDLPDGWVCPVCGAGKDQFKAE